MAKLMEIVEYPLSNDSVFDSAIYSWRLESYVYIHVFKFQIISLLLSFIPRLSMYVNKPFWINDVWINKIVPKSQNISLRFGPAVLSSVVSFKCVYVIETQIRVLSKRALK